MPAIYWNQALVYVHYAALLCELLCELSALIEPVLVGEYAALECADDDLIPCTFGGHSGCTFFKVILLGASFQYRSARCFLVSGRVHMSK